jgi:copper transport protein
MVFLAAVVTVVVPLGGGSVALAQSETENSLSSSEPADGATLAVSPAELRFTFVQEVDPTDALSAPVQCGNQPQQIGIPTRDDDDERVVVAEVLSPLPRGACVVSWLLRDELGETITSGVITFSVQSDPAGTTGTGGEGGTATTVPITITTVPTTDSTGSTADEGSAGGALWLGRVLSSVGILVLLGTVVLIGMAWPEGPEYLVTLRFVRAVWAIAMVGTVLFVVAFTADSAGRSFGGSLSPTAWLDLLDAGGPGRAALARVVFVAMAGWVAFRPERVIDPTSQLLAYGLPALAAATIGFGRPVAEIGLIGVLVAVLHALASGVWVGGAALVGRVVLAGPGEDDLVQAVKGFQRLSGPAILVTVATGVVQMLVLVGGALFSSNHGRVLLLKTLVVAVMVFLAMSARQVVSQRLARATEMSVANADRFRRTFGAEAGIGVLVLALSGWLLALTPANVDPAGSIRYAVTRPFVDPTSGLDLEVSVTPARVGPNGIEVRVNAPAEGITNLVVTFLPPEGAAVPGIEQPIPLVTAGTAVLRQEVGIPLLAPGTWTIQVSGTTTTGSLTAATSTFPVADGSGAVPETPENGTAATTPTGTEGGTIITVIVDPELPAPATSAP